MTELQKKSFELLQIFIKICEKWEIPYFLVCGSALGAVKYSGFIPWDDDIDVGLLREDYNRFLEVAPQELPDWCFLQNYKTEKYYSHTFSKLRNSNTAFVEKAKKELPMNHGIYLDIFPIDGYPEKPLEIKLFELKRKLNAWVRDAIYANHPMEKIRKRNKILRFLGAHKMAHRAHRYIEKLFSRYSPKSSETWCNFGNWQGKLEYAPRWHYGNGTMATFEGLQVRIPENYDAYLTQKYGDWRSDPPEDKQKSHHISTIVDTEKSYRFYTEK